MIFGNAVTTTVWSSAVRKTAPHAARIASNVVLRCRLRRCRILILSQRLPCFVPYGVADGVHDGVDVAFNDASIVTCSPNFERVKVRTVLSVSPAAATPLMIIW